MGCEKSKDDRINHTRGLVAWFMDKNIVKMLSWIREEENRIKMSWRSDTKKKRGSEWNGKSAENLGSSSLMPIAVGYKPDVRILEERKSKAVKWGKLLFTSLKIWI